MKPVLFQSGPTLGNELYFSLEAHFLSCTDFSIVLRFPRFMCKNIWIPFINILFFQNCGRFCYIIVLLLFCYIMIILLYHIFLLKYMVFKNQNTIYSTDNLSFYMFFSEHAMNQVVLVFPWEYFKLLYPAGLGRSLHW